jgi:murein L,D-transpeptidase YcbB/YkuD
MRIDRWALAPAFALALLPLAAQAEKTASEDVLPHAAEITPSQDDPAGAEETVVSPVSLLPASSLVAALEAERERLTADETLEVAVSRLVLGKGDRPLTADETLALRAVLKARGFDAAPQTSPEQTDDALLASLQKFQEANGLNGDGVIGQATRRALTHPKSALLDRIEQSLKQPQPPALGRAVVVNAAAQEVRVLEDGQEIYRTRAVVGRTSRRTPSFSTTITSLLFNPAWHVPAGIERKDIVPHLAEDPAYSAMKGLRIYDTSNNMAEVQAWDVDWTSHPSHYRFVQPAGPNTALGQIKFEMPNTMDIYLHDTPERDLFAKDARFFSSGCVRVQNPMDLARILLGDQAWDGHRIDERLSSGKTFRVALGQKVPVIIEYRLADTLPDGTVRYLDDTYGQMSKRSGKS